MNRHIPKLIKNDLKLDTADPPPTHTHFNYLCYESNLHNRNNRCVDTFGRRGISMYATRAAQVLGQLLIFLPTEPKFLT